VLKQRRLVLESYRGRSDVRTTFYGGERLTFGNYGDRRLGFERLQREERSKSVMQGNVPCGVEEFPLQSVDGFFCRSHCTTR